jgi:hypothetical protein
MVSSEPQGKRKPLKGSEPGCVRKPLKISEPETFEKTSVIERAAES